MATFTKTILEKLLRQDNDYRILKKGVGPLNFRCSVIIPVYNQNWELSQCIKSLIRQKTKFKFEIIVVDDHSDEPINLEGEVKNILKIKVINLNRQIGAAGARNIGINAARHGLIIFLDADMIVPPNFINNTPDYIKYTIK